MVASGYLTDRINRTLLLASIYGLRAFTFLLLPLLVQETSVLWVFAVLFGIFDYATVPPTASLAAGHLGKERVGTAMGLISAGHSIGAALGAFMGGYLFDATGGYSWLWSSSFGLALLAAAIAGLVPPRSRTAVAIA
jgi:predicted MFS family arabinose efflux permease